MGDLWGSRGLTRGASPRGRKSNRPPLRPSRSRRSRPSARSSHEEVVWRPGRITDVGVYVANVESVVQDFRRFRRSVETQRPDWGSEPNPFAPTATSPWDSVALKPNRRSVCALPPSVSLFPTWANDFAAETHNLSTEARARNAFWPWLNEPIGWEARYLSPLHLPGALGATTW